MNHLVKTEISTAFKKGIHKHTILYTTNHSVSMFKMYMDDVTNVAHFARFAIEDVMTLVPDLGPAFRWKVEVQI